MFGVEELKLRKQKLRWFGHVERAREDALSEMREMRVGGRRLVGRPRKWSEHVREDMNVVVHIKNRRKYGTRSGDVENSHRSSTLQTLSASPQTNSPSLILCH